MVSEAKKTQFGVGINLLTLDRAVSAVLERLSQTATGSYVCLCNVHLMAEADTQIGVKRALNDAYLCLPDGLPLVWYARSQGHDIHTNVRGSDLMQAVCQSGVEHGVRHVLYGGHPKVLDELQHRLRESCPGIQIVDAISPPFRSLSDTEQEDLIDRVNSAEADLVWVCLGAPRQELWMRNFGHGINASLMLGVGAAFEFLAGNRRPAPVWMQQRGLEWLFRLVQEPGRLWYRYLVTNSRFLWMVLREFIPSPLRGNRVR